MIKIRILYDPETKTYGIAIAGRLPDVPIETVAFYTAVMTVSFAAGYFGWNFFYDDSNMDS